MYTITILKINYVSSPPNFARIVLSKLQLSLFPFMPNALFKEFLEASAIADACQLAANKVTNYVPDDLPFARPLVNKSAHGAITTPPVWCSKTYEDAAVALIDKNVVWNCTKK